MTEPSDTTECGDVVCVCGGGVCGEKEHDYTALDKAKEHQHTSNHRQIRAQQQATWASNLCELDHKRGVRRHAGSAVPMTTT